VPFAVGLQDVLCLSLSEGYDQPSVRLWKGRRVHPPASSSVAAAWLLRARLLPCCLAAAFGHCSRRLISSCHISLLLWMRVRTASISCCGVLLFS
jgi:hypothetical protein